jgi:hypothetical protein
MKHLEELCIILHFLYFIYLLTSLVIYWQQQGIWHTASSIFQGKCQVTDWLDCIELCPLCEVASWETDQEFSKLFMEPKGSLMWSQRVLRWPLSVTIISQFLPPRHISILILFSYFCYVFIRVCFLLGFLFSLCILDALSSHYPSHKR